LQLMDGSLLDNAFGFGDDDGGLFISNWFISIDILIDWLIDWLNFMFTLSRPVEYWLIWLWYWRYKCENKNEIQSYLWSIN
jgi:hypothetical protein